MKNPLKIITKKQIAALAVIPLVALSMNAQAVVLIDFSDATAAGAGADGNGNYWTSVGDAGLQGNAADLSVANLIDSTNSATTIDLDINFSNTSANGWGGNGIDGPPGSNPFDQTFAVTDGIYSNTSGGLVTLTFSDLDVNTKYNLSLIGGRASAGTDGVIGITTGTGSGGILRNNGTQLDLSIFSDSSGEIAFTFVDTNFTNINSTTLNAMSIALPEPSSTALLGLGGVALMLRRRRK
jgi:hypothetical protein